MLSRAAREEKAQQWLARLEAWRAQDGGISLAQFARAQGWQDFEAYRWARILRRQGRWQEPMKGTAKSRAPARPGVAKFVRVKMTVPPTTIMPLPLTLRVQLANGRSGELDLEGTEQLLRVLAALEQPA